MGRDPTAWYNRAKKGWYVELDGAQIALVPRCLKSAETRAQARKALRLRLQERDRGRGAGLGLLALAEAFLDAAQRDLRPLTYEFYGRHVGSFWRHAGVIAAAEVRPLHVTAWLDAHAWGPTTRNGAITAVKRMFRWGKKQGHLAEDPLADMEKPTAGRREEIMTPAQADAVLAAVKDQAFRDLLVFMGETGARPSEAMAVEARHVDLKGAVIALRRSKTGRKTGERVIHLSAAALELCRRLVLRHPEGPILRNTGGNPWRRNATACRFARLRIKLGLGPEATLESYRHAFITDGLEAGLPTKTVAELAGHASTAMIDRHYSHLHRRREHLKEAMGRVRPAVTGDGGEASRPGGATEGGAAPGSGAG